MARYCQNNQSPRTDYDWWFFIKLFIEIKVWQIAVYLTVPSLLHDNYFVSHTYVCHCIHLIYMQRSCNACLFKIHLSISLMDTWLMTSLSAFPVSTNIVVILVMLTSTGDLHLLMTKDLFPLFSSPQRLILFAPAQTWHTDRGPHPSYKNRLSPSLHDSLLFHPRKLLPASIMGGVRSPVFHEPVWK